MSALDTKSLLAMSRTCSAFRSLLHSSQGTSCWKAARRNTSLMPDLKARDLTEWEYASLLFDNTCHVRRDGSLSAPDESRRLTLLAGAPTGLPQAEGQDARLWPARPRVRCVHARQLASGDQDQDQDPPQGVGVCARVCLCVTPPARVSRSCASSCASADASLARARRVARLLRLRREQDVHFLLATDSAPGQQPPQRARRQARLRHVRRRAQGDQSGGQKGRGHGQALGGALRDGPVCRRQERPQGPPAQVRVLACLARASAPSRH